MKATDDLITTAQTAKELGISMGRVRQLKMDGRLMPAATIANLNFYKRRDVAQFAKKHRPRGRPVAKGKPAKKSNGRAKTSGPVIISGRGENNSPGHFPN